MKIRPRDIRMMWAIECSVCERVGVAQTFTSFADDAVDALNKSGWGLNDHGHPICRECAKKGYTS